MRHEMAFVNEGEQLSWAAGCLWAGLAGRFRTPDLSPARLGLSVLALFAIFSDTFPTALTAAYKLNATRWATALGGFTVGDDYHRLIPLMDAIPLWVHGMMIAAAACYLFAIVRLLLRMSAPYVPVLLAVAVEVMADRLSRPIIDAVGVRANPNPSLLAMVLPIAFPLGLAALMWLADRTPYDTGGTSAPAR
jgi:hypothetical protein